MRGERRGHGELAGQTLDRAGGARVGAEEVAQVADGGGDLAGEVGEQERPGDVLPGEGGRGGEREVAVAAQEAAAQRLAGADVEAEAAGDARPDYVG